jgi:hypothetical protein
LIIALPRSLDAVRVDRPAQPLAGWRAGGLMIIGSAVVTIRLSSAAMNGPAEATANPAETDLRRSILRADLSQHAICSFRTGPGASEPTDRVKMAPRCLGGTVAARKWRPQRRGEPVTTSANP